VPFIREHRERFVLKPNDDDGGAGITLGWTVDDSAWDEAVTRALAAPHIVRSAFGSVRALPESRGRNGSDRGSDARHGTVRELR
jgi:hypothetical protein